MIAFEETSRISNRYLMKSAERELLLIPNIFIKKNGNEENSNLQSERQASG